MVLKTQTVVFSHLLLACVIYHHRHHQRDLMLVVGTVCCLTALYHSSAFPRRQFREQFEIATSGSADNAKGLQAHNAGRFSNSQ
ncbi:hypothetical protein OPV22_014922 [Ensete ventricosum]|uniref:Secreted protein n=1 Tax=Ensete ventricosum TaxID=4639 RepID=A0AAV8RCZ1_ENSVE|nr:hypothetical protein OPV22_014922 [Ensete ventricosum]